jgi:hypothetical protein
MWRRDGRIWSDEVQVCKEQESSGGVEMSEKKLGLAVTLYEYKWKRALGVPSLEGRQGNLCRVLARGARNSCLIEFVDGAKAIVSRNAIRRYRGERE